MIRYELCDEIGWVTLNRPEKRNALDLAGWRNLREALDRASEEARVAVLTGAGEAFCAGDDVATLADLGTREDAEALAGCLYEGLFGVERLPVPVVAAVDGPAYGGGFELVAAADLAVATGEATFALPETRVGAYPPYAAARIGAICGKKRLLELALTGEPVDAKTAHEWGLVNRVVEAEDLADAVAALVDPILDSPSEATRLVKQFARDGVTSASEHERVRGGFAQVAACEACGEAAQSFLEESD